MDLNKLGNYLSLIDDDMVVAFEVDHEFSAKELKNKVYRYLEFIKYHNELYWIVYEESAFEFLAKFLALNIANRTVVLPANNKIKTMDELIEKYAGNVKSFDFKADKYRDDILVFEYQLNIDNEVIIYTSGSTGNSKKVGKSLALLLKEIEVLNRLWGDKYKRLVATVSHQHLYGLLFRLLWPFFYQKPFLNKQIKYPEELKFIKDSVALVTSPAILARLDPNIEYSSFSAVFSSGGPLDFVAAKQSNKLLNSWPIEVYGSTETGGIGYRTQKEQNTYWTLFPNVKMSAFEGVTTIQSELNSACLDDKIIMLSNSQFELAGRLDRVIKYEEKRLSLDQLEKVLENHPWVKLAKCLILETGRKPLAAVVNLTMEGDTHLKEHDKKIVVNSLKQYLLGSFELSVLPKKWRFVENFPINSMNKVILTDLRDLFK